VLVAGDLNADGVGDLVASTWTSRETDVLVSELRPGPSGPLGDSDGDGVANACDACPLVADPEQLDGDGDGWGDACDHCGLGRRALARDEDGDGVADACDACVLGAAGLPEVSPLQVRVRKVPATRDLEIAFDASVVPDVVQHVNLVRGTIAAFRTPRRYDHGTEGGGACALVASPWIAGGGQDGGDAYFLVAGGCAQGAFEADGSHGRAWNRRARPERPTASELGTLDCP
jgi:hypothetical protein